MAVTYYTEEEYEEILNRAENAERLLKSAEAMRPMWAKGYTSDSIAAQASSAALLQLWDLLGVKDQTQAVQKLKGLLK